MAATGEDPARNKATSLSGVSGHWSILLQEIVHNAARTAPLCGIVWAEKLLDTTDPMEWSLGPANPLGSAR